jgi:hypothetical protein
MLISFPMARRPDREKVEIFSEKDLEELRYNLAHLSPHSVRKMYEGSHEECRLVHDRVPSPKKIQRLIQVWKTLWRWR